VFVFRLESVLGFCIVAHLIAIALADNAFRRDFCSIEEIFSLEIPAHKNSLKVKFRQDKGAQLIFRKAVREDGRTVISDTEGRSYQSCRSKLVWLGLLLGSEFSFEWYQLRRGSGRNLNREQRSLAV
jgi:hypothetical protein